MVQVLKKSFLAIAIIIIIISLIFLLLPKSTTSNGLVTASFSKKKASPGETIYLTVNLKNSLGVDLTDVEVDAVPVDNTSLIVANSQQFEDIIGKNEVREFKFPVMINKEARAGVYSIKINSNLKDFKEIRMPIKVIEK